MGDIPQVEPDVAVQEATASEREISVKATEASTSGSTIASTSSEVTPQPLPATDANVESQAAVSQAVRPPSGITSEASNMSQLRQMLRDLARSESLEQPEPIVRDMSSHRFWATQPVLTYDEDKEEIEEGPIKSFDRSNVSTEPTPLREEFEWVTMDLKNDLELKEVYELLNEHYVEDVDAEFRLHYSASFLRWALQAPGWSAEWHVGVRVKTSKRLVAFISGIPVTLRVRQNTFRASEINFLCIHKNLRDKRLTPILIKEVTRRCQLDEIWQAIYTGGKLLPTPVSTTRYFHRPLDWQILYDVGFSQIPTGNRPADQVRKYALPEKTSTPNLRAIEAKDVDAVHDLLRRYLCRSELAPIFTKEEVVHWFLKGSLGEQVVWAYVVEDANKTITDFVSFYALDSSVLGNKEPSNIHAAYLFYYATEVALSENPDIETVKKRLQVLINDTLILAKQHNFVVFNALSLMDNPLFIDELKFLPGTGLLHYYLYNYRANAIAGGVNEEQEIEENRCSGVGFVGI